MSEKLPSKDEALEALDFIVNVLKEHEKDLDKLVSELGTVANQIGETSEFSDKVKKIEDKINGLQDEVNSLVNSLSEIPRNQPASAGKPVAKNERAPAAPSLVPSLPSGPSLVLQCKQWEDFRAMAAGAQTVFFSVKESEKTFEIDAVKDNYVITFSGELPNLSLLLKAYLVWKLQLSEGHILEGDIVLG